MRKLTEKEKSLREEHEREIDTMRSKLNSATASATPSTMVSQQEEKQDGSERLSDEGNEEKTEAQLIALREEMERAEQVYFTVLISSLQGSAL